MRRSLQGNSKGKCDEEVKIQSSMTDMTMGMPDATGESKICKHCRSKEKCGNDDDDQGISSLDTDFVVFTSFINFSKPTMNATLATGLQFVHELCTRLLESENHFIQIFSKYIRDPSLQRELLDTLNQHSKLQWETERRTNTLANDMWIYQIEIGRTQEKTLQETLNALVKQNRQLQLDHETLFKKNERLVRNLRALPDGLRDKCMEFDTQMDHTDKHNEKLCYKLERYLAEIESLENELDILQKQNDCLEQQLRNSTSQIQNVKAMFQRSKTDYELEIVDLNHRLLQREAIIKEATEAGDILLEDLDGVKRQIKSRSLDINWSKFKVGEL
ncbi:unnamed protein product [Acanthoscelides obtectus]|uniref:Uncharacterized protein n=1 Tax=Acanthoscelides obtectus TaxID=200917 RepID=A0A9P0PHH6_ACAOB|nr:unnamed protein product [Acanthoscelides obtectus]CAK1675860.1 hypothetical protein AOBTE_LOCUS30447 [Acanthoscelides obtectus]